MQDVLISTYDGYSYLIVWIGWSEAHQWVFDGGKKIAARGCASETWTRTKKFGDALCVEQLFCPWNVNLR